MSNTRKWLIGIGVVGVLCLAACVVMALVVREAGTQLGRAIRTDATGVAQVGARIADFDLPPGYVQGGGMSMFMYDFVAYEPSEDSVGMSIVLMQFRTPYSSEQMQQALQQQTGQSRQAMRVVNSYETKIRDQTSTVVIQDSMPGGQASANIRELFVTFPGNNGTAMLMMMSPRETWDQKLADQFIASIR